MTHKLSFRLKISLLTRDISLFVMFIEYKVNIPNEFRLKNPVFHEKCTEELKEFFFPKKNNLLFQMSLLPSDPLDVQYLSGLSGPQGTRLPEVSPVIPVYILSGDSTPSRIDLTKMLFSNPLFVVHDIPNDNHELTSISPTSQIHFNPDKDSKDMLQTMWALKDSKIKYPKSPTIIIKDSSVSNADAGTIANIVTAAATNGSYDLVYLCKWLDKCQLYTDKKLVPNQTTILATTQSPSGLQAIMYSLSGRDIMLKELPMKNGSKFIVSPYKTLSSQLTEEIFNGNLSAECVVPNLIDFDITKATNNSDYMKSQECQNVTSGIPETRSKGLQKQIGGMGSGAGFGIFLAVVLIILLVAWAFLKVGPQKAAV